MRHNTDHIEVVAGEIVERMSVSELEQHVYEDLLSLLQDKEVFNLNVESLGWDDSACQEN